MKTRTLLVFLTLLAALVLGACGPATIVANPAPPQRTLSVNGSGTVNLTPDIAYINIGVHTENASASEAVSDNNLETQQVIEALKELGVAAKDIRTVNFNIWPNTQYDPQSGKQIGTTYVVDNIVYVTIRDMDKLGDILDAAVRAGANSINSIQFDVTDKTQALKQARAQAVKDAQSQAQEMAASAGVTLGEIQSISFFNNVPGPLMDVYGKGGAEGLVAAAPVPVNPGQLTLTVTVSITYEIK